MTVIAVGFQLGISQMRAMLANHYTMLLDLNHSINVNIKPVNSAKCFQDFLQNLQNTIIKEHILNLYIDFLQNLQDTNIKEHILNLYIDSQVD